MAEANLVYITGISGSGKSTVCKELKQRGFKAYDTDKDGIAYFYNNETGQAVTERVPPEERTPEWRSKHTFKIKRETVEKLLLGSRKQPIFLCGVTSNDADELWDLFSKVFALTVDEPTLRHRITTRPGGCFGKNPHEFATIVEWQKTAAKDYTSLGAVQIDASRPVQEVADDILARARS